MAVHDTIYVELDFPENASILLINDEVIAKAVKDARKDVFVNVRSDRLNANDSAAIEYISFLYSKIWDEMILRGNLQLACMIFWNRNCAGFPITALYSANEGYCNQPHDESVVTEFLRDIHEIWMIQVKEYPLFIYDSKDITQFPTFKHIAVGGTFDRLHNGHRKLLTLASNSCQSILTIGVTGDVLLQSKSHSHQILPYDERVQVVNDFLHLLKPELKLQFACLSDPFGPTITDPSVDAIVVSSETIKGALKINEIRKSLNMKPLAIFVSRRCDLSTLSSTYLRQNLCK